MKIVSILLKIVSILLKIAEFHPKIIEISGIPATIHSVRMNNSILSLAQVLQPFDSWTEASWLHEATTELVVYEGLLSPGEVRRDTYLNIKVKIKHLQKLHLTIFPSKIKYSFNKKFSNFDEKN